jgi:hypothetical protein
VNPFVAWWFWWLSQSYFWWGGGFVPPPAKHLEEQRLIAAFKRELDALPTIADKEIDR